jgi:hypothetical protein
MIFVAGSFIARGRLTVEVRDVLWAEDAGTFLAQRITLGPWASVFHVYEGYLHVVPRLMTDIAFAVRPIDDFAFVVSTLSCLAVGAIAALVYVLSSELLPNRGFRLLLASVVFLLPSLPLEVLGNMANIHWLFLFLAPWLYMYRSRTWWGASVLAVIGLLCSLTEIQMLLFAPLALLNVRHPKSLLVSILTTVGGLLQVAATVLSPRTPSDLPKPSVADIGVGFVELPILGSFEGHVSRIGGFLAEGGLAATISVAIVTAVILGFAMYPALRGRGTIRILSISLVASALALWSAAIWVNPNPRYWFTAFDTTTLSQLAGTRYMVVPSMLIVSGVIVTASFLYQRGGRSQLIAGVAVGIVAMSMIGSYQLDAVWRTGGERWSTSVDHARETCGDGASTVEITVTPQSWSAIVPCSLLLDP